MCKERSNWKKFSFPLPKGVGAASVENRSPEVLQAQRLAIVEFGPCNVHWICRAPAGDPDSHEAPRPVLSVMVQKTTHALPTT